MTQADTSAEAVERLAELTDGVHRRLRDGERFVMRVPAEPDRDMDLILARAAATLRALLNERDAARRAASQPRAGGRGMTRRPPPRPPGEDPALIADLAEAVYRDRLGEKDAAAGACGMSPDTARLRALCDLAERLAAENAHLAAENARLREALGEATDCLAVADPEREHPKVEHALRLARAALAASRGEAARRTERSPAERFAAILLPCLRGDRFVVEGWEIEEAALKAGLIAAVEAQGPCGAACACADMGLDFPTTCHRLTDAGKALRRALPLDAQCEGGSDG